MLFDDKNVKFLSENYFFTFVFYNLSIQLFEILNYRNIFLQLTFKRVGENQGSTVSITPKHIMNQNQEQVLFKYTGPFVKNREKFYFLKHFWHGIFFFFFF